MTNLVIHCAPLFRLWPSIAGVVGGGKLPTVTPIQGPIFIKNGTVPVVPLFSYPSLNNGTFVQIPVSLCSLPIITLSNPTSVQAQRVLLTWHGFYSMMMMMWCVCLCVLACVQSAAGAAVRDLYGGQTWMRCFGTASDWAVGCCQKFIGWWPRWRRRRYRFYILSILSHYHHCHQQSMFIHPATDDHDHSVVAGKNIVCLWWRFMSMV